MVGPAELLADVEIVADAGTLGVLEAAAGGARTVRWTPPRIAGPREVELSVRGGKRSLASGRVSLTPPPSTGRLVRSSGPLRMEVPLPIVLGRDAAVSVSLGALPDGGRLTATAGELEPPAKNGAQWRVRYRVPTKHYPQVAILVAWNREGEVVDWLAVPLSSLGRIETRTEPAARVEVEVGEERFGPFVADRRGRVSLAIVAPPGLKRGRTIAEDSLGNRTSVRLDLGVPDFERLFLSCASPTSVTVLESAPDGSPALEPTFKLRARGARLGEVRAVGAGRFEAQLRFADDAEVGSPVEVTARARGDHPATAACATEVPGGVPTAVALDAPAGFTAGSGTTLQLTVIATDAEGRAARPVPVTLEPSLGEVTASRWVAPGKLQASWRLPDAFAGAASATMTARADGPGDVQAQSTVSLLAGEVVHLAVQADSPLVVDGIASTSLEVEARDRFGNRALPSALRLAAAGHLSPLEVDAERDLLVARYTAGEEVARSDRVVVRTADGRLEDSVALRPRPIALPRVGVLAGGATNFGRLAALVVHAEASWPVGPTRVGLALGLERHADRKEALGIPEEARTRSVRVPLTVRVEMGLDLSAWRAYGGLGGGLAWVWASVRSPSVGDLSDRIVQPVGVLFAGAERALGPGLLSVELGYRIAPVRDALLAGEAGGLVVIGGYRHDL